MCQRIQVHTLTYLHLYTYIYTYIYTQITYVNTNAKYYCIQFKKKKKRSKNKFKMENKKRNSLKILCIKWKSNTFSYKFSKCKVRSVHSLAHETEVSVNRNYFFILQLVRIRNLFYLKNDFFFAIKLYIKLYVHVGQQVNVKKF